MLETDERGTGAKNKLLTVLVLIRVKQGNEIKNRAEKQLLVRRIEEHVTERSLS